MSLEMFEEEEENANEHQPMAYNNENECKKVLSKCINDNQTDLKVNEEVLSMVFSQLITSDLHQFSISLSKDQLYDAFLLFQNVLKTYQTNNSKSKGDKALSNKKSPAKYSIRMANLITETTDSKDDDRRNTNTNNTNYRDNSRNNNITFNTFDTSHNNNNNNYNNQCKSNYNYDDKPIRPANANFVELVEKNLAIEDNIKDIGYNNQHQQRNTHKKRLKESKYIKKSWLKANQEKKNKIYMDHIIANYRVKKEKSVIKSIKKKDMTIISKIIENNDNNSSNTNAIMPIDDFENNEIIEPVLYQDDEDLVNQNVSFNSNDNSNNNSNSDLLALPNNNKKSYSVNKQIKPLKEIHEIKVKTNQLFSKEKKMKGWSLTHQMKANTKTEDTNTKPITHQSNTNSKSKNNTNSNHTPITITPKPKEKTIAKFNSKHYSHIKTNTNTKLRTKSAYSKDNSVNRSRIRTYNKAKDDKDKAQEEEDEENKRERQRSLSNQRKKAIRVKLNELNTELIYFKREKEKVHQLRAEYEHLHETLQDHTNLFNSQKTEFEEYQQEEQEKFAKEREALVSETNNMNYQKETTLLLQAILKENKTEIETLKNQISSMQMDIRQKDNSSKNTIEKLRKQVEVLLIQHINTIKAESAKKNNKSSGNSNANTNSRQSPILKDNKKPLKVIQININNNLNKKSNNITINFDNNNNNKSSNCNNNNADNSTICNHLSTQFNTISHKSLDSMPIAIKEDQLDFYDFILPEKFHKREYTLLNEEKSSDGKIIRLYTNDKREIVFSSGVRKELYQEGYQIIYFSNGDIKQVFPNQKYVYYFNEAKTVQTVFNDGLQVFKFANGQTEKHYLDGSKRIIYPNGSIRTISKDGQEKLYLNDDNDKDKE